MISKIKNLIKWGYVSLVGNDSGNYPTSQVTYMGKTKTIIEWTPYGFVSKCPTGGISLMFALHGNEENIAGIFNKPESRIKFYYLDCFDRRKEHSLKTFFFLKVEKFLRRFLVKKQYPFSQIYHGSSYWALDHRCVSYVLKFLNENEDYVKFFKTSHCPDESFIHTIVGNSPFFEECKDNLTYADWTSLPGPALINEKHIELFKSHVEVPNSRYGLEPFFARKFSDESKALIERIENELRK